MIYVVSAVIIEQGRILLTQRPHKKDYPHTWECPGGKVEPREGDYMALARELREELALVIGHWRQEPLWSEEVVPGLRVTFFRVWRVQTRPPIPREGQGIGFFTDMEMQRQELTPGNKAALGSILQEFARE